MAAGEDPGERAPAEDASSVPYAWKAAQLDINDKARPSPISLIALLRDMALLYSSYLLGVIIAITVNSHSLNRALKGFSGDRHSC